MEYLTIQEKISRLIFNNTKKQADREVRYIWKSAKSDLETLNHTGEPVGVQVELNISHDKRNKCYSATLRKVHWQTSSNANIEFTICCPFDRVNYPFATIWTKPTNRYSEKSFNEFASETLTALTRSVETNDAVKHLVNIASELI